MIEYLIGIDFGAGETSASYYDLFGHQTAQGAPRLHRLSIVKTGDVYKVCSAIRRVADKWRLVTDPADFRCSDLRIDFKKAPHDMSPSQRKTNMCFWNLVFDSIIDKNNNPFLTYDKATHEKNFYLLVARPSFWTVQDASQYVSMMREAGLPVDYIVKESDAALVKWANKAVLGNNTLVIDCGSSTIDITLNCDGKCYDGPLFDIEPPAGAHRVEDLLYSHFCLDPLFVSECKEVSDYLSNIESELKLENAIKLCLRNVKETYYSNSPEEVYFSLKKRPFTNESGDILDIYLTKEEFEDIVSTYFYELRRFFTNVRDKLQSSNVLPTSIILSGGASRMPLVKKILSDIFGLNEEENTLFHDKNEADFVVSDGLALYLKDSISFSTNVEIRRCKYTEDNSIELFFASKNQAILIPRLYVRFHDFNNSYVFEKQLEMITADEEGTSVRISIAAERFNHYYHLYIDSGFERPLEYILFPNKIFIKANCISPICTWFAMKDFGDYYVSHCPFSLIWMLNPDLTYRRTNSKYYAFQYVTLDDMSSDGPYSNMSIQVKNVNKLLSHIQGATGLKIELLYDNDEIGDVMKYAKRAGLKFYDPAQSSSDIWFKFSKTDYLGALRNGSTSLVYDKTNEWGVICGEKTLSQNESLVLFDMLLKRIYPHLY